MLHCVPRLQFTGDHRGVETFHGAWLNIWDDLPRDDPNHMHNREDYDDINEAIRRLRQINSDPEFAEDDRGRASAAVAELVHFKEHGYMPHDYITVRPNV